jgi:hypothetical protein
MQRSTVHRIPQAGSGPAVTSGCGEQRRLVASSATLPNLLSAALTCSFKLNTGRLSRGKQPRLHARVGEDAIQQSNTIDLMIHHSLDL